MNSRIKNRRRSRGTAMVEGALMFPLLVTMYGAIMMTGRAHTRGLKTQQAARRVAYHDCATVMPYPYAGEAQYGTSTSAGGTAPDADFELQNPNHILSQTSASIDAWFNAVMVASYVDPILHFDQQFNSLETRLVKVKHAADFHGGYMNFAGDVSSGSYFYCQRGRAHVAINDERSILTADLRAFAADQAHQLMFAPGPSTLPQ